jgi:hypothetical protein
VQTVLLLFEIQYLDVNSILPADEGLSESSARHHITMADLDQLHRAQEYSESQTTPLSYLNALETRATVFLKKQVHLFSCAV